MFNATLSELLGPMPTPRGGVRRRDEMRAYQVRAAQTVFEGKQAVERKTGLELPGIVRDGTAIHIDMGLGKTVIGLTAIRDWFAWGVLQKAAPCPLHMGKLCRGHVLVVAPIKVCTTVWRQEAKQWEHTKDLTFSLIRGDTKKRAFALAKEADIYLVNRELLVWLQGYLRQDWSFFDALIIDESSLFKDNRAKSFRVLTNYGTQKSLKDPITGSALRDADGHLVRVPPHRFKRSAVLTGTPSPSGLQNLWGPFYIIDHGHRLHASFDTYQSRFFHKAQQVAEHVHKYELNKEEDEERPAYIAREGAPEKIHELIADVTVELNAEDYGVLPATLGDASKVVKVLTQTPFGPARKPAYSPTHDHFIDLPDELRRQYDMLEKDALLELGKDVVMAQNGGAKSMMCWQIANGAIHRQDDFGRKYWDELHTLKLDAVVDVINEINGNVVVPYYFTHDRERLVSRFKKEGMFAVDMRGSRVESIVDRWNNGQIEVLLLHPQSAGHGLNLQFGGHNLVWFTMLWSLERYLQTNARLARSGQAGIVGIHHILAKDTTDELMYANLGEHGDDQTRFRAAIRSYQALRGMGLYEASPLEGLGL